ncbi:uncharacterized protein [Argopecten irradians]|uniref:uncharacterized protein n=1 Tax=Argopecten irradians TaxID=31199 RepID=UPI003718C15D
MLREILLYITFALFIAEVKGHGRLLEPPSRASMWRRGFNSPKNYNDNQLFCGGFYHQWTLNGGKCGVCGDPWDGPRDHEAGGKYATGTITRNYKEGATIDIEIQVTASHHGFFEFRLCPNNDPSKPVTQDCLDRYLLHQPDGKTRVIEVGRAQMYKTQLVLPEGVTCSQCLLQWKWNTGNSYGCDAKHCCKGCGQQEQFYGCSDISITANDFQSNTGSTDESKNESGTSNEEHEVHTTPTPVKIPGNQPHQQNIQHPGQLPFHPFLGGQQPHRPFLQTVHGFLPINVGHPQIHHPIAHVPTNHLQTSHVPVPPNHASIHQNPHIGQTHLPGRPSIPQQLHPGLSQHTPIQSGHAIVPQHPLVHGFLPINVGVQNLNGHLQGQPPQHMFGNLNINLHPTADNQMHSFNVPSHGSVSGYVPQGISNNFLPHHQVPIKSNPQQYQTHQQHISSSPQESHSPSSNHLSVQSVSGFLPINTGSHFVQGQQQSSTGSQQCRATPAYRAAYAMADQYCIMKCRQGQCPAARYCLDSCRH